MSIGAQRQRRGNTLATGHRIALVRWIIQIVGIAETISLKQKSLSCVLWERVGIITPRIEILYYTLKLPIQNSLSRRGIKNEQYK